MDDHNDVVNNYLRLDFDYVQERPVDDELLCAVCRDPLVDPVVEPSCRQMFCRPCLVNWLAMSTSCPHCRQPVASIATAVPPPRFISGILDSLLVVCPACRGHVERKSLRLHFAACLQPCKLGCGEIIAPVDVDTHGEVCPAKLLPCPAADVGCGVTAPRPTLKEHTKSCSLLPLRHHLLRLQALEKGQQALEKRCEHYDEVIAKLEEENGALKTQLANCKWQDSQIHKLTGDVRLLMSKCPGFRPNPRYSSTRPSPDRRPYIPNDDGGI